MNMQIFFGCSQSKKKKEKGRRGRKQRGPFCGQDVPPQDAHHFRLKCSTIRREKAFTARCKLKNLAGVHNDNCSRARLSSSWPASVNRKSIKVQNISNPIEVRPLLQLRQSAFMAARQVKCLR